MPLQEQSGFGTELVIHPWADKKCNFVSPLEEPGPGVKVTPAGTGRGWVSPMWCGLILPARLLGWEDNAPGAASSPRREVSARWVGGYGGALCAM